MKDSKSPTRRQIKTSEKQTVESTTKAWDSYDHLTRRPKPPSKLGLPLEKRMKQEKRRWHVLTNEHNRLTFAVNEEEAKLKRLQESLKAKEFQPTSPNDEDTYKQRMRKLENNRDKIKMKIIEATEIQTAYEHIHEHLQREVQGMFMVMEQKHRALTAGLAELDRVTKHFRAAAADSTVSNMVQMEDGTMKMKTEMENELCKLRAEEKELKRQIESIECPSSIWQSRQQQQEIKEEDLEAHSVSFFDHQCFEACGASQSDFELVADMEALREALGYTKVKELVDKVVSQRAVKEQLFTETIEYKDTIRKETEVLTELELRHAKLQFGAKPKVTRFELKAELKQKMEGVQQLQAKLKQCQDLLDTVERGVNNLYFSMLSVPVEGMPSVPSADSSDRLREVRARLPTLLQRASELEPEIRDSGQKKGLFSWAAADGSSSSPRRSR